MFISHILSGILMLKIFSTVFPNIPFNAGVIIITIILQLLPDIDILWAKNLSSHHESYFHAPLFWIGIFLILTLISNITHIFGMWIAYVFIIQTLSHLFFDYITARTAGIQLFYPFIEKEYSLFPLNKKHGDFKPFELKAQLNFFKPYSENMRLLFFEIIICVLGIVALLI
jgi:hypothetical protein